jgi:hypothetical protein
MKLKYKNLMLLSKFSKKKNFNYINALKNMYLINTFNYNLNFFFMLQFFLMNKKKLILINNIVFLKKLKLLEYNNIFFLKIV